MAVRFGSGPVFGSAPLVAISIGLLALMVSGPFLLPFHFLPIASFWNEWWAGALGLAAAVFGLSASFRKSGSYSLPLSSLLLVPTVLLAALLIQYVTGRLVFPQLGLLYAAYLLWASLLMILGRVHAHTFGLVGLFDVLGAAITIGALIGTAVAIAQWMGLSERVPWMFPSVVGGVSSNIGQRNNFTQYSWLGIASAFYLCGRRHVSRPMLWLLLLAIAFGSVVAGSRSIFLYLTVILAALGWARRRDPFVPATRLVIDAALLAPALVAMNFFAYWVEPRIPEFWTFVSNLLALPDLGAGPHGGGDTLVPVFALYENSTVPSTRLAHWRAAWSAFVEHPWLGQGAGNVRWAIFLFNNEHEVSLEHVHNFVFQLLAEFGAPATVAVVALLLVWGKRFLNTPWRLEHFWCASVLGIGAVHSLVEYPLWYSYFLGPTALLLGATDNSRTVTLNGRRVALYLILVALTGTLILGTVRADYSIIETVSYRPFAADRDRERAWRISMNRLVKLYDESLMSPWALLLLTSLAEPSRHLADERAELCERSIRFIPNRSLVTRCAMHLAIAGRGADARHLTLEVLRAYPMWRSATTEELARWAKTYPEIEPLRALSAQ